MVFASEITVGSINKVALLWLRGANKKPNTRTRKWFSKYNGWIFLRRERYKKYRSNYTVAWVFVAGLPYYLMDIGV